MGMGAIISSFSNLFSTKKPYSICMIGLDSAGKTTILYQMQTEYTVATVPTIGFNIEKFKVGNVEFNCWDIGGQDRIRPVWSRYVDVSDGIVFVIDIYDEKRWEEAKISLKNVMSGNTNKPLLILANKSDDPNDPDLIYMKENMLNTLDIKSQSNFWECRTVSAISTVTDPQPSLRLVPAFEWMVEALESREKVKGDL